MVKLVTKKKKAALEKKEPSINLDIRAIPVGQIYTNEYNPNDMDSRVFNTLVEQIKEDGMPQPILVREIKKNKFIVVDGEHRFKASVQAGLPEVAVVVVDYDEDKSRFKTISFNEIRGEYIPLKMANLLADLSTRYDEDYIIKMTGMKVDTMESLSSLLDVPEINFDSNATISSMDVSRPIPVSLMLMPDEHSDFDTAMTKAMNLGGTKIIPLVAEEVGQYDYAMSSTLDIAGVKLRNVGLANICRVFNSIPKAKLKKMIEDTLPEEG